MEINTMTSKNNFLTKMEAPNPIQYAQLAMLSIYILLAWFYLRILRPEKFYYVIVISFVIDFLFNCLPQRRTPSGKIKFPITGFVVGCALSLLIETSSLWYYALAAVIAVSSKTLVQVNNKHVFNPGNLGVVAIVVLTGGAATVNVAQWSGATWILVAMFICGSVVAYLAHRLTISLAYLFSFFTLSSLYSFAKGLPPFFMPGSLLGISTALFTFHMITDPVTSPESKQKQVLMGFLIAAVDLALRANKVLYAQLIALIIVLAIFALFKKESC